MDRNQPRKLNVDSDQVLFGFAKKKLAQDSASFYAYGMATTDVTVC